MLEGALGNVKVNNRSRLSDATIARFTARVTYSFGGLTAASLRAAVPIGGDGWKIGASYGNARYKLGKDFANLRASGNTQATGAFVSYPWVRSQK